MKKTLFLVAVAALFVAALGGTVLASSGYEQYGYNDTARIFNGTGATWSLAKGLPADYLGSYSNDKLIMKWNAEWDRGNAEGWANPPYGAWLDNEWNGMKPGGSKSVWHYRYIWVGFGLTASPLWRDGGYPIWGQFEVIMDHGLDPSYGTGHMWFAKAISCGYGSN